MSIEQHTTDTTHLVIRADLPKLTPAQAFDHWVQPERLRRWWPEAAVVTPGPGGQYRFSWPGMNWHLFGVFRDYVPGQRLAYTWNWEHEPQRPERLVELGFASFEQGTRLMLKHGTYDASPADQEDRQSHIDGWLHFLPRLQSLSLWRD